MVAANWAALSGRFGRRVFADQYLMPLHARIRNALAAVFGVLLTVEGVSDDRTLCGPRLELFDFGGEALEHCCIEALTFRPVGLL